MSKQTKRDIHQLRNLHFDLANYFSNTIIPQLFVDADFVLRVFTPPAMVQFSLTYDDIGKNIEDVKDNIRYPTIKENIQEVIETSEIFEKEIQTTDGRWFQMNIIPYIEHELDKINGVIITFVNITKRLTTIRELEKINAEHQILMFALSHDMKQPISTMKLLAVGLQETYRKQDQEKFQSMIKRMESTSNNLTTLLDGFTSRGKTNMPQNAGENLQELKMICSDVLDALRAEIIGNNISIIRNFKVSEIPFPKNNLRSVVYNLLHNAIKYREPNRSCIIELNSHKIEGFIVLSVEDNGLGIAEEFHGKVFKKSSRLNKNIEGTGMGLYIIKKMIEAHGGRIELKSSPGKGSKFEVYFKSENLKEDYSASTF